MLQLRPLGTDQHSTPRWFSAVSDVPSRTTGRALLNLRSAPVRDTPAVCPTCQQAAPLVALTDQGERICGPCVGFAINYSCKTCGVTADLYERGRCDRCVMLERVRDLLKSPTGEISPALQKLAETFENVDKPRSVIRWLQHSAGARLLATLAATDYDPTHDTLDALPQTKYLHYIRQALVHAGVLPERSEYLDRIRPWIDKILTGQQADYTNVVRVYAHWYVLRRARQRTQRHDLTFDAGRRARTMIQVALELLVWLQSQNRQLSDLRQHDVEEWLTLYPGRRSYLIDGFLKWANERGLADRITITHPPRAEPANFIDEDYRWQEFHRCLDDDRLPLTTRVAGALLFLYGLPPSRMVTLRSEHIEERGADTFITVGDGRLLLPPKLASLVTSLRDAPNPSVLGRARGDAGWLFRGQSPGRPLSVSALRQRLNEAGIRNKRAARNTALIALVTDLPAPIVADLLGIHIETAARWSKYAKRDWIDYLAARAEDQKVGQPRTGNTAPSE